MDLNQFLLHLNQGKSVKSGSDILNYMCMLSDEALRITNELNNTYHTAEEIISIFSKLTGKDTDKSFRMFPPFYTDCGKNIEVGKNVFINSCCNFQDQGGIRIGDNTFVGHKVIMATLNHGFAPEDRATLYPAPIIIGKNVWIGSGSTIIAGVTVGDNSIIAAGSVVTKDVAADSVVAGVPAKFIKSIFDK